MDISAPDIRAFRINEEFSIPSGGKIVYKFVISTNTILTLSSMEVDQGGLKYSVYAQTQTTELTPFNTSVPIYRRNLIPPPIYQSKNAITKGGTASFTGVANTVLRVRTSSGNNGRASTINESQSSRAFPASVVYVEFMSLDGVNTTTTGVWSLEWQEIGI